MSATNLMAMLAQQADRYGDKIAFSFSTGGEAEQARIKRGRGHTRVSAGLAL
ncbi:hypothetical protein [Mycolicibacter icosiumassiliensis]|uniref:hypothetical protein n=1 Tax=Mycolicibacter icosiumassiliensis TaxID=1792835 RepID=UPI000AEB620B|nr:hypothetical protein [Mycolicibacter icosiumassiliensis]